MIDTRMTWNLILKFFSLLILIVVALYLMNPTDVTLASLSVLKFQDDVQDGRQLGS